MIRIGLRFTDQMTRPQSHKEQSNDNNNQPKRKEIVKIYSENEIVCCVLCIFISNWMRNKHFSIQKHQHQSTQYACQRVCMSKAVKYVLFYSFFHCQKWNFIQLSLSSFFIIFHVMTCVCVLCRIYTTVYRCV